MIKAIIVCEGEYVSTVTFRDQQHRNDYESGFSEGTSNYGCGSAGIYSLDQLSQLQSEKWMEKEASMVRKHLGA